MQPWYEGTRGMGSVSISSVDHEGTTPDLSGRLRSPRAGLGACRPPLTPGGPDTPTPAYVSDLPRPFPVLTGGTQAVPQAVSGARALARTQWPSKGGLTVSRYSGQGVARPHPLPTPLKTHRRCRRGMRFRWPGW